MERTLLIVKPDALQRKLAGRILSRFEEKGFQIVAAKMARLPEKTIREHYGAHQGKAFYEPLVRYMTAQPVLLLVVRAKGAIAMARKMMGATFGSQRGARHDPRRFRRQQPLQPHPRLRFARGGREGDRPLLLERGDLRYAGFAGSACSTISRRANGFERRFAISDF